MYMCMHIPPPMAGPSLVPAAGEPLEFLKGERPLRELLQRAREAADGWASIGGRQEERGRVRPGMDYAEEGGRRMHATSIHQNTAKPSPAEEEDAPSTSFASHVATLSASTRIF